jgi:dihydrofolate synthase/folylpolyglutamate synthase
LQLLPTVGLAVSLQHIQRGISRVVADTGLPGRWEQLDSRPLTICETAHNADGIEAMLHKLASLPYRRLHLVYGCVNDKDYVKILHMLPSERTTYYYTQPSVPRGLPVDTLAEAAKNIGMPGLAFPTVGEAIRAARAAADPDNDLVLVTGSIFLVADAVGYYSLLER